MTASVGGTIVLGLVVMAVLCVVIAFAVYGIAGPILAWRWGVPGSRASFVTSTTVREANLGRPVRLRRTSSTRPYYDDGKPVPGVRYYGANMVNIYGFLLRVGVLLLVGVTVSFVVGVVTIALL